MSKFREIEIADRYRARQEAATRRWYEELSKAKDDYDKEIAVAKEGFDRNIDPYPVTYDERPSFS